MHGVKATMDFGGTTMEATAVRERYKGVESSGAYADDSVFVCSFGADSRALVACNLAGKGSDAVT